MEGPKLQSQRHSLEVPYEGVILKLKLTNENNRASEGQMAISSPQHQIQQLRAPFSTNQLFVFKLGNHKQDDEMPALREISRFKLTSPSLWIIHSLFEILSKITSKIETVTFRVFAKSAQLKLHQLSVTGLHYLGALTVNWSWRKAVRIY